LDLLCSPDVLAAELTALDLILAQNPADLDAVRRKAQVAFKQQVLFRQVESGDLTLALLKDNMVNCCERDKHLVRILLKRGNKPFAGRVLQRSKVLQAEIEAAEQMIQKQAEVHRLASEAENIFQTDGVSDVLGKMRAHVGSASLQIAACKQLVKLLLTRGSHTVRGHLHVELNCHGGLVS